MTDLHTAAKQALEALESYAPGDYSTGHVIHPSCDEDAVIKAITALRQAIANEALDRMAENARELGLDYTLTQTGVGIGERAEKAYEAAKERGWVGVSDERLMEMPAQQEPVGEAYLCDKCSTPFDGEYYCPKCGHDTATKEPVYTRPQAREWVGLTDEEIMQMLDYGQYGRVPAYARNFVDAIEAKLREKNA